MSPYQINISKFKKKGSRLDINKVKLFAFLHFVDHSEAQKKGRKCLENIRAFFPMRKLVIDDFFYFPKRIKILLGEM